MNLQINTFKCFYFHWSSQCTSHVYIHGYYFISAIAYTNLAYGRPTRQSTSHENYPSFFATDGIIYKADIGFTHTNAANDPCPWWTVDLGQIYRPEEIIIANRYYRNSNLCKLIYFTTPKHKSADVHVNVPYNVHLELFYSPVCMCTAVIYRCYACFSLHSVCF